MHGQPDHGRADTVDNVDNGPRIGIEELLIVGNTQSGSGVSPRAYRVG
jgi:hypothetical protein